MVDYPTIPKPRVGDKLVADIFIGGECQECIRGSLQRCRRALGIIFLSDMTASLKAPQDAFLTLSTNKDIHYQLVPHPGLWYGWIVHHQLNPIVI